VWVEWVVVVENPVWIAFVVVLWVDLVVVVAENPVWIAVVVWVVQVVVVVEDPV